MRAAVIVVSVALLAGCSYQTKWTDITGQGRSEAVADADYETCRTSNAYPQDHVPTRAETMLIAESFRNCMAEHGWRMDRK